jgi:hypothetical protein
MVVAAAAAITVCNITKDSERPSFWAKNAQ